MLSLVSGVLCIVACMLCRVCCVLYVVSCVLCLECYLLCLVSCVLSLVSRVLCLPSGLRFVTCALWPAACGLCAVYLSLCLVSCLLCEGTFVGLVCVSCVLLWSLISWVCAMTSSGLRFPHGLYPQQGGELLRNAHIPLELSRKRVPAYYYQRNSERRPNAGQEKVL